MKKSFLFLIIAIVALISVPSCVKQELIPENENIPVVMIGAPLNDGLISIKASWDGINLLKSGTLNDTVNTEQFMPVTYQAIESPGLTIVAWQWTFLENNSKSTGPTVEFWHSLNPGSKTSVTLIGIEANGTAHIATKPVKIVYSLDGMPGWILVSKTPVAGGMYSYIFAAHKKGMSGVKGNYGYTGTVTSPTWTVTAIAPQDTNYNYINNALVTAPQGDVGKYIAIKVILYPSSQYEIHAGHISSTGTLIWGNFWSWYKDGKFTVNQNGDLSNLPIVGLPGASGDEGVNAVIRKDILNSSVIVYTKHVVSFTKGFVQLQNANGTWQSPVAETAVSGYLNWGKVEIAYTAFPTPEILVFRFGSNIDTPNIFSANMPFSGYWTPLQVLEMKVVKLGN